MRQDLVGDSRVAAVLGRSALLRREERGARTGVAAARSEAAMAARGTGRGAAREGQGWRRERVGETETGAREDVEISLEDASAASVVRS